MRMNNPAIVFILGMLAGWVILPNILSAVRR